MAQTPLRIVFMGTPEFAASILRRVFAWPHGTVVGVYTQPDRPAGRGNKIVFSPVKALALEYGIPVMQPYSFRENAKTSAEEARLALGALRALQPDFLLVAAYGLILPQAVLDVPHFPPLNVHASLLPRYRGAAPIQRAIMENYGDNAVTGVSIMQMEAGLDSGPVFATEQTALAGHTAGTLHEELARVGGDALCRVMDALLDGTAQSEPQNHAEATHAAKLTKEDGQIDWARPVRAVDAHVRGVTPWPGAQVVFSFLGREEPIVGKILPGLVCCGFPDDLPQLEPGSLVLDRQGGLSIACLDGLFALSTVKPQGRKEMPVADFVRGLRLDSGQRVVGSVCHV